jgi:hydrogenase expression/formation protein HypC
MCLAVPGQVKLIHEENPEFRTGVVSFDGLSREVNLTFVPEAVPGDYVLVHAGVAISAIDEEEARKVFEALAEMEALELPDAEEETPPA